MFNMCLVRIYSVSIQDEFRSGAEVSFPNIFFPFLLRKSSGFVLILPDFFARKWLFEKFGGGGGGGSPPSPMDPYAYDDERFTSANILFGTRDIT